MNIQLPEAYWVVPPRVTFLTKVWHPNVSSTNGSTCLFTTEWSGALTLPKMLLSRVRALGRRRPDESPHDTVVAAQYVNQREMFERTARDWTRRYAKKPVSVTDRKYTSPRPVGERENSREYATTTL